MQTASILLCLFLFASVVLAAILFGARCMTWIKKRQEKSAYEWIISFFLGFGLLSLGVYILAVFSIYTKTTFSILIIILLIIARKEVQLTIQKTKKIWQEKTIIGEIKERKEKWEKYWQEKELHEKILVCILVVLMLFHSILTFFPLTEWDAVVYHLPVAEWYATTGSVEPPVYMFHAQFPQLAEVMMSPGFLLGYTTGDLWVKLLLIVLHNLFFLALYYKTKEWFGKRTALYALVIAYTMPEISIYITDAYIDIIAAAYQFFAFAFVYELVLKEKIKQEINKENKEMNQEPNTVSTIILAYLFSGIAAGIKYPGLFMVFFTSIFCFYFLYVLLKKKKDISLKKAASVLLVAITLASLFFVPQYAKNWEYTKNPVWPFLLNIFPESKAMQDTMLQNAWSVYVTNPAFDKSNPFTFLLLPLYMTFTPSYFGSVYNVGPFFFLLLPITAYFILQRKEKNVWETETKKSVLFILGTAIIFLYIWYKTQHSYRLYFFGFFILAIAAAKTAETIVDRLKQTSEKTKKIITAGFIGIVLINSVAAGVIHRAAVPVVFGQEDIEWYKQQKMQIAVADRYISEQTPEDAVILLANDLRGYYVRRTVVWGEPINNMMYIDYRQMETGADLAATLKDKGITHIRISRFAQYNYTYGFYEGYYGEKITQLYDDIFANHATKMFEENNVLVYEIK